MQDIKCISDKKFFQQKKKIQEYIYEQYQEVATYFTQHPAAPSLFQHHEKTEAKIYRGENFLGTPYYILDLPRIQSPEHILLLRLHTWWGEYWSISLLLKGSYQQQLTPSQIQLLQQNHYHSSGDLWLFDYRTPCLPPSDDATAIKYYKTYPLNQLEQLATISQSELHTLIQILSNVNPS